jgi:hypothetical protein
LGNFYFLVTTDILDAGHGCGFQREKMNGLSIKNKKTTRKAGQLLSIFIFGILNL